MTRPIGNMDAPKPLPVANTPAGSATRHFVTGILAALLGGYAARKGVPVPPEVLQETSGWVLGLGTALAAGAAGAVGALWRKVMPR